jgi:hypothetical protein
MHIIRAMTFYAFPLFLVGCANVPQKYQLAAEPLSAAPASSRISRRRRGFLNCSPDKPPPPKQQHRRLRPEIALRAI